MQNNSTEELMYTLKQTSISDYEKYTKKYEDEFYTGDRPFMHFFKERAAEKGLRLQDIFLQADIPERYGYKLISGEKRTRQRDVILRLCYAAHFNVDETQKALRIYGMSELYPRYNRDCLLILAFNERPGDIITVNEMLKAKGFDPLRSSGTLD